jgi:hypothetical protein
VAELVWVVVLVEDSEVVTDVVADDDSVDVNDELPVDVFVVNTDDEAVDVMVDVSVVDFVVVTVVDCDEETELERVVDSVVV